MKENSIKVNEKFIKYRAQGGMIKDQIYEVANELLALKVKHDAILTTSDRLSTNALNTFSQMKIKVAEHISLAGFTNFVNVDIFDPPLTAVMKSAFEMSKTGT